MASCRHIQSVLGVEFLGQIMHHAKVLRCRWVTQVPGSGPQGLSVGLIVWLAAWGWSGFGLRSLEVGLVEWLG